MNDSPRGIGRVKQINSLLRPSHVRRPEVAWPNVQFGQDMTSSRLDSHLDIARPEFSDTPLWLRALNDDPCVFPKKTLLGTIWQWVDTSAVDGSGQTEIIKAVIASNDAVHYPEILAEFEDTDVNVQDDRGGTALHWACAGEMPIMVMVCLSVTECNVGLTDHDVLTVFDISYQSGNTQIPTLFYKNGLVLGEQTGLLRVLDMASDNGAEKPILPGVAMFKPVEDTNEPLVNALSRRGIDLIARNINGDTPLHVAAAQGDNTDVATMLLEAGYDVHAIGNHGATVLHHAVYSAYIEMVRLLVFWDIDSTVEDWDGVLAMDLAKQNERIDMVQLVSEIPSHRGARKGKERDGLVRMTKSVQTYDDEIAVLQDAGTDTEAETSRAPHTK